MVRSSRPTPQPRRHVNPIPLVAGGIAAIAIVATFAMGAGSGTAAPQASLPYDCGNWCGSGTATIHFADMSGSVTGGGCYDGGAEGIDARFGDWQGVQGVTNYLVLTIMPAGAPQPTAEVAGETPIYNPIVAGNVNGLPFVLGPDTVIRYSADGTGTFSGTDMNGGGEANGTFTCR